MVAFWQYLDLVWDICKGRWHTLYHPQRLMEHGDGLRGTTAVVTGATRGIGVHTAVELAKLGAKVVLAVRDTSRAVELVAEWQAEASNSGEPLEFDIVKLDLGDLSSVRKCAATILASYDSLDFLINNAGLFRMGVSERGTTANGYETHFGVNYIGPFLLTSLLLPALKRSRYPQPRVVNVSSRVYGMSTIDLDDLQSRESYAPGSAYSRSKLSQILFTTELQRRLPADSKIKVISLHPGNVVTDVTRDLHWLIQFGYQKVAWFMFLTPRQGAMTSLVAATSPTLAGGAYLESCTAVDLLPCACDPKVRDELWRWTCRELQLSAEWPGEE